MFNVQGLLLIALATLAVAGNANCNAKPNGKPKIFGNGLKHKTKPRNFIFVVPDGCASPAPAAAGVLLTSVQSAPRPS